MSGEDRPGAPDEGGTGSDPGDERAGRVAVIGPGRVGQSLAAALSEAGRRVTLRGRRPDRPGFLDGYPDVTYLAGSPPGGGGQSANGPGGCRPDHDAYPDAAATLVFCVPDDALAGAAADWARALARDGRASSSSSSPSAPGGAGQGGGGRAPGPEGRPAVGVALHTSGVHGADVLAPLRDAGRAVAAWHPLTALSAPRPDAFGGVTFAVEGDGAAVARADTLAGAVGGRSIRLEAGANARYHAAAVFASNYLVACLAVAARELAAATGGEGSLDDLLPLARAAVDNLARTDLDEGATGPLARGDAGTVRRHLRALTPEAGELYRRLARELLDVVEGRLDEPTAEELRRALDESAGDGSGRG